MGTGWCFRALRLASVAGSILAIVSACGGSTRTGDPVGDGTGGAASTGGAADAGGSGAAVTSLDVRDFDQSCEDSSDCRPVRDGDQCVCGLCPTAAINNAAVSAWEAASEAMDCPRIDCNHSIICEPKAYGCRDNRCVVVNAPNIDATPSSDPGPRTTQYAIDYDQRCEVASDCRVVTEGLKCCMGCAQYGAISNGAFSTWESDLTLIECPGDPLFPCAGAPTKPGGCSRVEPIVTCVSGRCEVGAE